MNQEERDPATRTCDVVPGIETVDLLFGFPAAGPVATVYLRHSQDNLWCAAGGQWHFERTRAIRFSSNIDALIYCQAVHLNGIIIGFDRSDRPMYQLRIDRLLELVCGDAYSFLRSGMA